MSSKTVYVKKYKSKLVQGSIRCAFSVMKCPALTGLRLMNPAKHNGPLSDAYFSLKRPLSYSGEWLAILC